MGWKNVRYKTLYSLKIAISNTKAERFIEYKISGNFFIVVFKDAKIELKISFDVSYKMAKKMYNDTVNKIREKGFTQFRMIEK